MSELQPNLFSSLFQWRPRETKLSAENFLTESFVYCLQVNEAFRAFWLGNILGQDISAIDLAISTRASHIDDERETTIYPDIDIRGRLADGKTIALLIEVKWGAPYDGNQIRKYDRLLGKVDLPFLVFISASRADCCRATSDASGAGALRSTFQAIPWEQVHRDLAGFSAHCRTTKELEEFMDRQGLSARKPLSSEEIDHFLASRNVMKGLKRYCEKLLREHDWTFLPAIYQEPERQSVADQYGRMAIVFRRTGWNGTITVGFLHSNHDHKVKFADGSDNSVDLMMRIECGPSVAGRDAVMTVLRSKAAKAGKNGGAIHLADDVGNANRHTLFIAQRSLNDFLMEGDEAAQLSAMHAQVADWANALFEGGDLEAALCSFDAAAS